jgi:hypothetical protein
MVGQSCRHVTDSRTHAHSSWRRVEWHAVINVGQYIALSHTKCDGILSNQAVNDFPIYDLEKSAGGRQRPKANSHQLVQTNEAGNDGIMRAAEHKENKQSKADIVLTNVSEAG